MMSLLGIAPQMRHFMRLDIKHDGHSSGWVQVPGMRTTLGRRFALGEFELAPAVVLGYGEAEYNGGAVQDVRDITLRDGVGHCAARCAV